MCHDPAGAYSEVLCWSVSLNGLVKAYPEYVSHNASRGLNLGRSSYEVRGLVCHVLFDV